MALTLYYHPISQYSMKALIALYEHGAPFVPRILDPADPVIRAEWHGVWPLGKMPVLRDAKRDRTVAEASVVVEYVDAFYATAPRLVPADPDAAWQVRMRDRMFDLYIADSVAKVVLDTFRPEGQHDVSGVAQAKAQLATMYGHLDRDLSGRTWAAGDAFSLADCAAAPSLFYAEKLVPFGPHKTVAAYASRLRERPSFARVLAEAKPLLHMFPFYDG
jgi:glutathione S-transferase